MKKKTFKIGEYAIGGIITVESLKGVVDVRALDWNTKEKVSENTFTIEDISGMDEYLNELTSCYYTGKVLEWIKSQTQNGKSII